MIASLYFIYICKTKVRVVAAIYAYTNIKIVIRPSGTGFSVSGEKGLPGTRPRIGICVKLSITVVSRSTGIVVVLACNMDDVIAVNSGM
jgi:hypothetical protein